MQAQKNGSISKSKYNYEIGLYRIILVLLVMVGHSALTTCVNYSMVITDRNQYSLVVYILNLIYQFHMPAFLILTGFLYRRNGRFYNLKKSQQKLIKFSVIVVIVQNLTFLAELVKNNDLQYIEIAGGTFDKVIIYMIDALLYQSHAWYLQCYILCFIFQKIFQQLNNKHWEEVLTVVQLIVFFIDCYNKYANAVNIPRIVDIIMYNMIWFYVGTLINKYEINKKLKCQTLRIQIIAIIWVLQVLLPKGVFHLLQGLTGQFMLLYFVKYAIQNCSQNNKNKLYSKIKRLDQYSFIGYIVGFIVCVWYQALWILINLQGNEVYWDSTSIVTYFIGSLVVQFVLIYLAKYIVDTIKVKNRQKNI